MKRKTVEPSAGRHTSDALRREQELCMEALSNGRYDNMSDADWVTMCEQIAHEEGGDSNGQEHASKEPASKKASRVRNLEIIL